jgi:hypothetical protein
MKRHRHLRLEDVRISTVGIGSLPLFLDTPFVAATSPCSKPAPMPSGEGEFEPAGPGAGTELTRRVLLLLVPSRADSSVVGRERGLVKRETARLLIFLQMY